MKDKLIMKGITGTLYVSKFGHRLGREGGTMTPNRTPMSGEWVFRDPDGFYLDHDQYRLDLASRHNLELIEY